jgi:hypothetical protein
LDRSLIVDLVRVRPGRRTSKLVAFAVLSFGLLFVARQRLIVDQPIFTDGHAIASLEFAMTRAFCHREMVFPGPFRVPHYLRDHPQDRHIPLRDVATTMAGSLDRYCAAATEPFVNNENSLMVIEAWWLERNPGLSLAGLGTRLEATRVVCIVAFASVLVAAGFSVLAGVAVVAAGLLTLGTMTDLVYTQYPFLFALLLCAFAWWGLVLMIASSQRLPFVYAGLIGGGAIAALGVNMRSSYLPIYVTLFVVTLSIVVPRVALTTGSRLAAAAVAIVVFSVAYSTAQYVEISRYLSAQHGSSYHLLGHPLVLALAVPPSDLSRREGIEWADSRGLALARRIDPEVTYFGPGYDHALLTYYRSLWRGHPREMLALYWSKLNAVGLNMIPVLRGDAGRVGAAKRLLTMPFAWEPNGAALFAIFGVLTAVLFGWAWGSGSPLVAVIAMASVAAILVVIESAIIMPLFIPGYHNYLVYYVQFITICGAQLVVEAAFRVYDRLSGRSAAA